MPNVRIAFFTDVHLGHAKGKFRDKELAQLRSRLDQLRLSQERFGTFDNVIFGGDAIEVDWDPAKCPAADLKQHVDLAKSDIQTFFRTVSECLVKGSSCSIPESRICVIPGNHDSKVLELKTAFFDEARRYGFGCGSLESSTYKPVAIRGGNSRHPIDILLLDTALGSIDTFQMEWLAAELRATSVPRVAILHHPPVPILDYSAIPTKVSRAQPLENTGQVLELLINSCALTLSGHFHHFYAVRCEAFSKITTGVAFARRRCVHVVSGGAMCEDEPRLPFLVVELFFPRSSVYGDIRLFESLLPGSANDDDVELRELAVPGQCVRTEWQHSVYLDDGFHPHALGLPPAINSEHPIADESSEHFFRTYERFCSDEHTRSPDDPRSRIGEVSCPFLLKEDGGYRLRPMKEKLEVLVRLLERLRKDNRSRGYAYSSPRDQLRCLYDLGTLFFTRAEALEFAELEFAGRSAASKDVSAAKDGGPDERFFRDMIDPERLKQERGRGWSHLDWANDVIASAVSTRNSNTPRIRIVEGGFGGLCTIMRILHSLHETRRRADSWKVEYIGCDVSTELVQAAERLIEKYPDHLDALVPRLECLPGFEKRFVVGEMRRAFADHVLDKQLSGTVHCVVISYALHHTVSSRRLARSIATRDIRSYLGIDGVYNASIRKLVMDGVLWTDYVSEGNRESLVQIARDGANARGRGVLGAEPIPREKITLQLGELRSILQDEQMLLVRQVYNMLQEDGVVCIADPDGFSSSFNRVLVFEDPLMVVQYFNDLPEAISLFEWGGFVVENVWRQVRMRDNTVANIAIGVEHLRSIESGKDVLEKLADVQFHDAIERQASRGRGDGRDRLPDFRRVREEPSEMDYDDVHLGYVLIARKPRTSEIVPRRIVAGKYDVFDVWFNSAEYGNLG